PCDDGILQAMHGQAVTKEKLPDNFATRIERQDHFRAESVEVTGQKGSLGSVGGLREIRAGDQMGVELKPTHQRVAFAKFNLVRVRQTAQAGPQSITIAVSNF